MTQTDVSLLLPLASIVLVPSRVHEVQLVPEPGLHLGLLLHLLVALVGTALRRRWEVVLVAALGEVNRQEIHLLVLDHLDNHRWVGIYHVLPLFLHRASRRCPEMSVQNLDHMCLRICVTQAEEPVPEDLLLGRSRPMVLDLLPFLVHACKVAPLGAVGHTRVVSVGSVEAAVLVVEPVVAVTVSALWEEAVLEVSGRVVADRFHRRDLRQAGQMRPLRHFSRPPRRSEKGSSTRSSDRSRRAKKKPRIKAYQYGGERVFDLHDVLFC